MKIMLFNTLYTPYKVGGAEVSVQFLAEELVRMGHKVRVITLNQEPIRKESFLNGVEIIYLPLKNLFWPYANLPYSRIKKLFWHLLDIYNPFMYKLVVKEIKLFSPDVVHTNNLSGFSVSVWDAVKKFDVKLIHTSRDYYLFHPNSTLFKAGSVMNPKRLNIRIWSIAKKHFSKKVDEYVGISCFIKKIHLDNGFFQSAKKNVIYNSVDEIKFKKTYSDKIRVGFIGRLTVEKGYDDFCNLAGKFKGNDKYKFIAAGVMLNNKDRDNLERLTVDSEVETKGFMSLPDFMSQVDIVVLPIKWNEPFGRTIVECSLSNKIVLTTSYGSMPELSELLDNVVITDDLYQGLLLASEKIDSNTIKQEVKKMFAPDVIAERYLKAYNKQC